MTESESVPDELRSEDRHQADGKAIVDMGYSVEYEQENRTEWVTVRRPERQRDKTVAPFVWETMESLGFRTVSLKEGEAVFSRVNL